MKRVVAIVAMGLAAVAIYAVAAPAGQVSKDPRVPGLLSKVNALSKKVTALNKILKEDDAALFGCVIAKGNAVPVAQFGNPTGNEGYVYHNADNTNELQTALDVSTTAGAQGYALITSSQCASIINGGKKARLSLHGHN